MDDTQVRTTYSAPFGPITLIGSGARLTGLYLDDAADLPEWIGELPIDPHLPVFVDAASWLDAYFAGEKPGVTPALAPAGTDFQQRVWELLLTIPSGELVTYGELARMLAEERGIERMAAQAVGGAVGRNPISIIIPCHRVVGSRGALTGYGGGIGRKIWLLEHEGREVARATATVMSPR